MIIINGDRDEHLDMLEGGVMRQLLDEKWEKFAKVCMSKLSILNLYCHEYFECIVNVNIQNLITKITNMSCFFLVWLFQFIS